MKKLRLSPLPARAFVLIAGFASSVAFAQSNTTQFVPFTKFITNCAAICPLIFVPFQFPSIPSLVVPRRDRVT